ncbi:formate dehydrogenase subunit delta [Novosphingobium sp. KACC 22771]|uniref:formate dehydrogenase subunit delta n=1 Tax=Novosphingobium sp. KACC 22771 TaxID=3025670 RepID=UPI002365E159|nr:formate dehydrogenase subunit delta [Novosphingobium sp. KACC 22771]WDF72317.1 formate dehydrogenase subunit delta [Novosphingobium sp. KACC 22771]
MNTTDHLIKMANQIAANLAAQGQEVAIRETAQHIIDFWDPRMKAGIAAADHTPLSDIARAAVGIVTARAG